MRSEQDIFEDLSLLCRLPGFAHVIAYFCYRDNFVRYNDDLKSEDLQHLSSPSRLLRTEIATLIGLMIKGEVDYTLPPPIIFQQYIDRAEGLLEEMHRVLAEPLFADFDKKKLETSDCNPAVKWSMLREPIFYNGESAYTFQYRDFSAKKYAADTSWLKQNKGFAIDSAREVVGAIGKLHEQKVHSTHVGMSQISRDEWTILPGLMFTIQEIAGISGIDESQIEAVLDAFTLPAEERNQHFNSVNDFNVTTAKPMLRMASGEFLLFQDYSLLEALYESPFYWMSGDKSYVNTAMENRGRFTEGFCQERLELVFGKKYVFPNVKILKPKHETVGEIDILILFGDRAIILQAKSKRLTLEARKGNDLRIKEDFKKAIQHSYDQGLHCAKHLDDSQFKLVDSTGQEIPLSCNLKEIYIFCVVSDHYPALNYQVRHFLSFESNPHILPPFVMDIFTLDAMTEMLQSPLYFLSYINRRVSYAEKLHAPNELTTLSFHLTHNLWIKNDLTVISLSGDISSELDVAMAVRREGVMGRSTPDGILTRLKSTELGRIVKEIETEPHPDVIDLGFFLLSIGEDGAIDVNRGISLVVSRARLDGKHHDATFGFDDAESGITIHCNKFPASLAADHLRNHCEKRKYSRKAKTWFGLCLSPVDGSLRFTLGLNSKWEQNSQMDEAIKGAPKPYASVVDAIKAENTKLKTGRNDPCPCGSGKKYKKCCQNRQRR